MLRLDSMMYSHLDRQLYNLVRRGLLAVRNSSHVVLHG